MILNYLKTGEETKQGEKVFHTESQHHHPIQYTMVFGLAGVRELNRPSVSVGLIRVSARPWVLYEFVQERAFVAKRTGH